MPHLPAIVRVKSLAQLASELAHAPVHVLLEDARRCEALGLELLASAHYDEQWLAARITGFAHNRAKNKPLSPSMSLPAAGQAEAGAPGSVRGSDVLHDLGALCELLCQRAMDEAKTEDEREALEGFAKDAIVPMAQLRRELALSAATMGRLRRSGMVTRRVHGKRNLPMVAVTLAHAARVRGLMKVAGAASPQQVPAPKRLSKRETQLYIRAALRYAKWAKLSLHAAAKRLAAWSERTATPRSVEGLRGLLQRDVRTRAVFPPQAKRAKRTGLAMLCLQRRGAEPAELAGLGDTQSGARPTKRPKTAPLVRREIALAKRQLLCDWLSRAEIIAGPQFQHAQAKDALLASVQTVTLHAALARGSAGLAMLRSELPLPAPRERELATAMHFLRWQAAGAINAIDHLHPSQHDLDRCETQLRGAWLLRCALAASQRRRVLETLEARCGVPWQELARRAPLAHLRLLLRVAHAALHEGVEGFDPFRGGRLAASCSLRIDRALARSLREQPPATSAVPRPGRAQALVLHDDDVDVLLASMLAEPYVPSRRDGALRWIVPDARVLRTSASGLGEVHRTVLVRRWLSPIIAGTHALPCTLRELGEQMGLDGIRAFALQQQALRACLAAHKQGVSQRTG